MQELLTYLLKSSGLTFMFFLAYYFLLRKETFFNSNRWFLLSGLVTSVILPLFYVKKIVFVEAQKIVSNVVSTSSQTILNSNTIEDLTINWFEISLYSYLFITLFLFAKIIFNLFSLLKVIKNKVVIKDKNFKVIDTNQNIAPFSFFNYIVLNSSLYSQAELESILLHEKIHSSQKHSIDVLLMNLFTVVFWFNPILYWYKKAIIQNLEYIADNKAIAQIEDKKSYQMVLLKVISNQNCLPITNHFYQSLIKKRIVMLNKNQSQKRNSWKYAVIIPALIGFVMLFQIKVIAQEKETKNNRTKVDSTAAVAVLIGESFIISKNTTENDLKKDAELLKKQYNIDCIYGTILRNEANEIIGIKATYKNNKGKTWTKNIESSEPIEPIVFEVNKNEIIFNDNFNSEYNYNEKMSKENGTDVWVKDFAEAYNNPPPTPPTAPTAPEIKINSIPVPNFPNAPKAPTGSPITNEKEWKKFDKKMEEFDKKMEAMQPETDAYTEKMSNIDEQMKPFEEEMKKFDKKMELFDEQMKEYEKKLEDYLEKIKSRP